MSDDIRLLGASTVDQAIRNFGGHVDQFERNLRYFDEIVERMLTGIAASVNRLEELERKRNEPATP